MVDSQIEAQRASDSLTKLAEIRELLGSFDKSNILVKNETIYITRWLNTIEVALKRILKMVQ